MPHLSTASLIQDNTAYFQELAKQNIFIEAILRPGQAALQRLRRLIAQSETVILDHKDGTVTANPNPESYQQKANSASSYGDTVLMIAVFKKRLDLVEALVQYGVNIHAKNAGGYSALALAIIRGADDIAEFLVKKGADLMNETIEGRTLIELAGDYIPLAVETLIEHYFQCKQEAETRQASHERHALQLKIAAVEKKNKSEVAALQNLKLKYAELADICANRVKDFTFDEPSRNSTHYRATLVYYLTKTTQLATFRIDAIGSLEFLSKALPGNSSIKALKLKDKACGENPFRNREQTIAFLESLRKKTNIETLALAGSFDETVLAALLDMPHIHHLHLNELRCGLNLERGFDLSKLSQSKTLLSFSLRIFQIKTLLPLLEACTLNTSINHLEFIIDEDATVSEYTKVSEDTRAAKKSFSPLAKEASSSFVDDIVASLCKLFKTNSHIQNFTLIDPLDVRAAGAGTQHSEAPNTGIFQIDRFEKLCASLAKNKTITDLSFAANTFDERHYELLLKLVEENLNIVNISWYNGSEWFESSDYFPESTTLRRLLRTLEQVLDRNHSFQQIIEKVKLAASSLRHQKQYFQEAFEATRKLESEGMTDALLLLGNLCEKYLSIDNYYILKSYLFVQIEAQEIREKVFRAKALSTAGDFKLQAQTRAQIQFQTRAQTRAREKTSHKASLSLDDSSPIQPFFAMEPFEPAQTPETQSAMVHSPQARSSMALPSQARASMAQPSLVLALSSQAADPMVLSENLQASGSLSSAQETLASSQEHSQELAICRTSSQNARDAFTLYSKASEILLEATKNLAKGEANPYQAEILQLSKSMRTAGQAYISPMLGRWPGQTVFPNVNCDADGFTKMLMLTKTIDMERDQAQKERDQAVQKGEQADKDRLLALDSCKQTEQKLSDEQLKTAAQKTQILQLQSMLKNLKGVKRKLSEEDEQEKIPAESESQAGKPAADKKEWLIATKKSEEQARSEPTQRALKRTRTQ